MKKMFTRFTLAVLALTIVLFALGWLSGPGALGCIVFTQLAAFAIASPQAALFMAALSDEQVQEFKSILQGLKDKSTRWDEAESKINAMEQRLNDLRRASLGRIAGGGVRVAGQLSDEAARSLAACVLLHAARSGKLETLIPDTDKRDRIFSEAKSIAGVQRALTTTEIPLPTTYGSELVALIAEFGVARRELSRYPLSGGIDKPPRWGDRPTFGSIAMASAVPEKKPTLTFGSMTPHKIGGIVIAPSEIDDQSIVAFGQFLANYGAVEFARAEDTWAFLADGTSTYEGVKGITKICGDNSKVVQMGAGKTHPTDMTLTNIRAMRTVVSTAALSGGKYYFNQSWESFLRTMNTEADPYIFMYRPDGKATFDGFEIVWTEVLQPYSTSVLPSKFLSIFGRLKFWYFGERGIPRVDTSQHAYFENDLLATRFLELIDFDYASLEAASALQTAAS